MSKIELLEMLTKFAKEYCPKAALSVHRNSHMNNLLSDTEIPSGVSDALIVDFINFVGTKQGVDYGLYTSDLNLIETAKTS